MRIENRKSERVPKHFKAVLERVATVLLDGESRIVQGALANVSREGMGAVSSEIFDRDAAVQVTIFMDLEQGLPSVGKTFTTACTVSNCTSDGAGCFRIGMRLKQRTGRELTNWNDLIHKWSAKVL